MTCRGVAALPQCFEERSSLIACLVERFLKVCPARLVRVWMIAKQVHGCQSRKDVDQDSVPYDLFVFR